MTAREKRTSPLVYIIVGGTGARALDGVFPALFSDFKAEHVPERFDIAGFGKRDISVDAYRRLVRGELSARTPMAGARDLDAFIDRISYVHGLFGDPDDFSRLERHVCALNTSMHDESDIFLHLAVPSRHYRSLSASIERSGFMKRRTRSRIVLEHPFFGEDARALGDDFDRAFGNERVLTVQHDLDADSLEYMHAFIKGNPILSEALIHSPIERIHIELADTALVSMDHGIFDSTGLLRERGRKLLELLALAKTLTETHEPEVDTGTFSGLLLPSSDDVRLAQYEGYRRHPDVRPSSHTETYAIVRTTFTNGRLIHTPIILEAGLALGNELARITITFESSSRCSCGKRIPHHHQNALILTLEPDIHIAMRVWSMGEHELVPKHLEYREYDSNAPHREGNTYARRLRAALSGKQNRFMCTNDKKTADAFIESIIAARSGIEQGIYRKGGMGPRERLRLLSWQSTSVDD